MRKMSLLTVVLAVLVGMGTARADTCYVEAWSCTYGGCGTNPSCYQSCTLTLRAVPCGQSGTGVGGGPGGIPGNANPEGTPGNANPGGRPSTTTPPPVVPPEEESGTTETCVAGAAVPISKRRIGADPTALVAMQRRMAIESGQSITWGADPDAFVKGIQPHEDVLSNTHLGDLGGGADNTFAANTGQTAANTSRSSLAYDSHTTGVQVTFQAERSAAAQGAQARLRALRAFEGPFAAAGRVAGGVGFGVAAIFAGTAVYMDLQDTSVSTGQMAMDIVCSLVDCSEKKPDPNSTCRMK